MTDLSTGVGEIIEIAKQSALQRVSVDGREFVVLPAGGGASKLEEIAPTTPLLRSRIRQSVRIDAKDSFVDYVSAFAGAATRIFADIGAAKFVAVIDYHDDVGIRAAGTTAASPVGALEHRATYGLQETEQWQRWSKISGRLMGQADFVRFLEENCADVATPSTAELLEICRDFSAARKVDFREAVRLDNGARQFEFSEEIRGGTRNGEIEVPSKFVLHIPVYYGELSQEVHAFLRYAIDGALQLGIELHRPKFVQQAAFEAIGREIAERTQKPLHYGALA